MAIDQPVDEHLFRIFTENFTARDIAAALVSFDETADASEVRQFMRERRFRIVGIRREGLVVGYVRQEELDGATCGDAIHEFRDGDVVNAWSSFTRLISALRDRERVFVRSFGQIGGLVSRSDLQKPPVRMWLFGMITIAEIFLTETIESLYPDDSWTELVSSGRMRKARELCAERMRRQQPVRLVDCLQVGDKMQLLIRDEEWLEEFDFSSRREGERWIKELGSLRNNLAHAQPIVPLNWKMIAEAGRRVDRIVARIGETQPMARVRSSQSAGGEAASDDG